MRTESLFQAVARRCRRAMIYPAVFSLVLNVLALTVPLYMIQVFDRVLGSRNTDTLLFLTLIALVALLVFAALDWIRGRMMVRVGQWIDRVLAPEALARALDAQIQGQSYRTEALRDIAQIRGFLSGPTLFCFFDAPWVPFYLIVIFMLHPALGAMALVGSFVLFGLGMLNEATTRVHIQEANQRQAAGLLHAENVVRNAEVIDAMGMFRPILARWYDDGGRALGDHRIASDRSGAIVSVSRFVRLALQMAMLGLGAFLVLDQRMTPGGMIGGSIILARALQPVETAIASWRQLVGARESYQRLSAFFARPRARGEGIELPVPEGRVEVERVVYAFPGEEKPALKGIGFSLPAGGSLAIVGNSASGKTTLARTIVGVLKPTSGAVRLDGADVFGWQRDDFGRHVGYLPQDVELFAGTVRDNIGRLADVSAEAVVSAAQLAGCHEMILRLPQGYETQIGPGGGRLSGGQRQRVALARALFGEPQLVVLDEPNASLDSEGEAALIQAIAHLKRRGATVIVIAHRMNLVQAMDRVLVLKEGSIDTYGPRGEVLAKLVEGRSAAQPVRPAFPRAVERPE